MTRKRAILTLIIFTLSLPFLLHQFTQWSQAVAAPPPLQTEPWQVGLVVDTTSSMGPELTALAQAWQNNPPAGSSSAAVAGLTAVDWHWGPLTATLRLSLFKDTAQYMGATTDYDAFGTMLSNLEASGGGACPDNALGGLINMGKNWGPRTPASDVLLVTDATPFGSRANYAYIIERMQRSGINVHALVTGWCNGAPISEAALQYLTLATGGRYYSPETPSELYTTTLMAQTRLFDTDLLGSAVGSVSGGVPDIFQIDIDSSLYGVSIEATTLGVYIGCLTCTRPLPPGYPGAIAAPTIADLQIDLIDPDDNVYDTSSPYFQRFTTGDKEMLVLRPPQPLTPGTWQVRVSGTGDYALSIGGQADLNMMYLGPTSLPLNRQSLVRVLLGDHNDAGFVPPKTVTFAFEPVNSNIFNIAWPVTLYDDGQHSDGAAGDGIYAGLVQPPEAGWWRLSASGETLDGTQYQRLAEVPVRVQEYRMDAATPGSAAAGETKEISFSLTNDTGSATTFDMGLFSEQGWTVTDTIPSQVTLQPSETLTLTTNVIVPPGAANGEVEESTLVAVAVGDESLLVTAVAETEVINGRIYLPMLTR